MIRAFWYQSNNAGDTLSPIILEHFTGEKVKWVKRNIPNKMIAVGSIMKALRIGDTVWGAGIMRHYDVFPQARKCKFLAVRGKLTEKILGIKCGVYGDPALLLPLIYNPKIEKKKEIGFIPHYIDKGNYNKDIDDFIDIELPWKEVVDKILECKKIESASLHGIVIAEAYGIPAKWVLGSDKILGGGFKFRDYLTGTGREPQNPGDFPPIKNLTEIQDGLIQALKKWKR